MACTNIPTPLTSVALPLLMICPATLVRGQNRWTTYPSGLSRFEPKYENPPFGPEPYLKPGMFRGRVITIFNWMSGVGLAVMVYTSSPVEEVLWMMENWSALQDRLSYLAD